MTTPEKPIVPKGWRKLREGERIKDADWFWSFLDSVWKPFKSHIMVGAPSIHNELSPDIRRTTSRRRNPNQVKRKKVTT